MVKRFFVLKLYGPSAKTCPGPYRVLAMVAAVTAPAVFSNPPREISLPRMESTFFSSLINELLSSNVHGGRCLLWLLARTTAILYAHLLLVSSLSVAGRHR